MFVNIGELQKITDEAKNKNNKELERVSLAERIKIEERANTILDGIPELCYNAAKEGINEVIVMKLIPSVDYHVGFPFNKLNSNELNECATIVFTTCVLKNLKPTIRYWSNDEFSGFNIVVSWKKSNK